jgi:osmotically-inducible protein OsmY
MKDIGEMTNREFLVHVFKRTLVVVGILVALFTITITMGSCGQSSDTGTYIFTAKCGGEVVYSKKRTTGRTTDDPSFDREIRNAAEALRNFQCDEHREVISLAVGFDGTVIDTVFFQKAQAVLEEEGGY